MAKRFAHARRGALAAAAITAVCVVLLVGLLIYDATSGRNAAVRSTTAMATVVTAKVWGPAGEQTAQDVLDRITALDEDCLSAYADTSDVYRINHAAGNPVKVNSYTYNLLVELLDIVRQTNGAFDPTIGALTALWDIGGPDERIPDDGEITAALGAVGWDKLHLADGNVQICKGQLLDLGAVGKGAACDAVRTVLEEDEARSAVISVGGSLLLYGENPEGDDWSVGVRDPRGGSNDRLGTLSIGADLCVSTSGDYERFFGQDGVRYCHILDPATGRPADSGLISVTIISPSGLLSDALSTACFVLGYERSLPVLELFEGTQALFVTADRTVYVTPGLEGRFTLTADGYTMGAE